ncbi:hypothetical protein CCH79_00020779, partial [Gambusia affinis]
QASLPERLLPQWLTGIVAVCGFLILTFIAALVKKVWCESSSRSSNVDAAFAEINPYENNLDGLSATFSLHPDPKEPTRLGPVQVFYVGLIRPGSVCRPRSSLELEKGQYETRLELSRARDGSNVYDNVIATEEKSTAIRLTEGEDMRQTSPGPGIEPVTAALRTEGL